MTYLKNVIFGREAAGVAVWTLAAALLSILLFTSLIVLTVKAQTGGLVITSGPDVGESGITETTAVIGWTTNIVSTSVVEFGTSPALGQTYRAIDISPMGESESYGTAHNITLWELQPGTIYHFKVRSVAESGASVESGVRTFQTKSPPSSATPAIKSVTISYPMAGQQLEGDIEARANTEGPADSLEFRLTDNAGKTTSFPASLSGNDWTAVLSVLAPGQYTLRAVASGPDGAGGKVNVGASSVSFTVKVMPPPPAEQAPPPPPPAEQAPPPPPPAEQAPPPPPPAEQAPPPPPPETPETAEAPAPALFANIAESLQEFQGGLAGSGGKVSAFTVAATAGVTAPEEKCRMNGIKPDRCAAWLQARYADKTCLEKGYHTKESCEKYLTDNNNGVFPGCEDKTAEECAEIKALTTAGYLPSKARQAADDLINKLVEEKQVSGLEGLTALSPEAAGSAGWLRSTTAAGAETSPAVMIIDGDRDGLPDDLEKTLGTDPSRADSDGDGISDADELNQGTDPLGPGQLEKELAPAEQALAGQQPLEQPLGAGEVDDSYVLELGIKEIPEIPWGTEDVNAPPPPEPEEEERTPAEQVALSGRCAASTVCLIYVYSYVPVVLTTSTAADGSWTYNLDAGDLDEGPHIAYVAEVDSAGKIVKKSNPLSLFIKEARAVTAEEYIRADMAVPTEPAATYQRYYLLGALALVFFAAVAFIMIQRQIRKSRLKNM